MNEQTASVEVRTPVMIAALAAWTGAVALALRAQHVLTPQDLAPGGLIYVVAALPGAVAIAVIDRYAPSKSRPLAPHLAEPGRSLPRPRLTVGLVLAGVGATALSAGVLATSGNHSMALLLWLVGLVLPTIALMAGTGIRRRFQPPRLDRARLVELAIVGVILAVAVLMRLPDLTRIPPEVHGDEAACGLEARKILHGEMPAVFGFGWYDVPNPSFAISAASMAIFGDDLFGFRMASVLQGLASILLLYLITRRLFSVRTAALAAFFLTISHWHIHFSRAGIHYMQATFATTLLLYVLLLALERPRALYFLLSGFAAGLCATVYYAARLAPLLAVLLILYQLLRVPAYRRRYAVGLLAFVLGMVLFLAPFSVPAAHNPQAVLSRGEGVFVLTQENLRHSKSVYQVETPAGVLAMQLVNTIAAFNARGDKSGQHSHPAPLIDFYTSALFVLGVAASAWRLHETRYFLLNSWLWATLVTGAVLTIDPVFSPRLVGVLPALFIFPALAVDAGWRGTEWLFGRIGSALFVVPVALLLLLATNANYQDYFDLHIKKLQTANFYTVLARYFERVNDRYRVYLLGKPDSSIRQYTVRFLVPTADGVDVPVAALHLPLDRVPIGKGVAFVVDAHAEGAEDRLSAIRETYPSGMTESHADEKGFLLFQTHTVDHADLLAANPDATLESPELESTSPESPTAQHAAAVENPAGRGKGAWSWLPDMSELRDVAVSPSGDVYALDRASSSVLRLGRDGKMLQSATVRAGDEGDAAATDIRAIAIGPDNRVFVLDSSRSTIYEVAADGRRVATITLPGGYFPSGLTIDEKGIFFVADTGLSRVVRLLRDGTSFAEIGRGGAADGKLDQPTSVAVSADGEIFAADVGHARVAVFGPDLAFRRQWVVPRSGTVQGTQLAFSSEGVFVSDPEGGRVLLYDLGGRHLAERGVGELVRPIGLAVDGKGALYVADVTARAIFRYSTREERTP